MATHAQRVERIARLVAQPSVSSTAPGRDMSNRGAIDALAELLDDAGFAVEVLPLPDAPEKANLIASFGKGPGGLVLAGHSDTVPFDGELWTSDPFKLRDRDGKLYGLGAADMKAFLALAVEAVEGLQPHDLQAPLLVLATADEETSMAGARALVDQQRPKARYAIIGEPTDMHPVRAHKGMMMERLRVIGKSGHSSDPQLGNSALDGMSRVLEAMMIFRDELARRHRHEAFALPTPTLNLGRIHGGDSPNRICGECELDFDLRPLPGMDQAALRAEIEERAQRAVANLGLRVELHSLFEGTPAFELQGESALLRTVEQLTGEGGQAVAFGTEAPYLVALGTETVVLGPGGIDQAHKPDEFVRAERLEPTVQLLKATVQRLCKTPPP